MKAQSNFLFTSESVTEGHLDKIADQIPDAVLDSTLAQDPEGRVACETLVTTGLAMIAGEITTHSCDVAVMLWSPETPNGDLHPPGTTCLMAVFCGHPFALAYEGKLLSN